MSQSKNIFIAHTSAIISLNIRTIVSFSIISLYSLTQFQVKFKQQIQFSDAPRELEALKNRLGLKGFENGKN